ncbi:MAG: hypothetical protein ACE14Q_08760 [Acidobacteriota bacterium]
MISSIKVKISLFIISCLMLASSISCILALQENGDYDTDVGRYNGKVMEYEEKVFNFPKKNQVEVMAKEANQVMDKSLNILIKGNCLNYLTDDIDKKQEALEKWVAMTKPSQNKIGLLLKKHPNVKAIAIRFVSFKGNLSFAKVVYYQNLSNDRCEIFMPSDDFYSGYSSEAGQTLDSMELRIRNIYAFYEGPATINPDVPFTEAAIHEKRSNDSTFFEEILASNDLTYEMGKGSKGLLICFTKKIMQRGSGYMPVGIQAYFGYNYDFSKDTILKECPRKSGTCVTFPLTSK